MVQWFTIAKWAGAVRDLLNVKTGRLQGWAIKITRGSGKDFYSFKSGRPFYVPVGAGYLCLSAPGVHLAFRVFRLVWGCWKEC
jgi:hypothetical protein